jgi:tRNA G18 (ribose-2'-O)-methylase SpoU
MNDCSSFNVADHFKHLSLDQVQQFQRKNSLPYAAAALNLSGSLNLGMMIRTAVIFGCEKFFVVGKKRYDRRSTVGAHNYIDIKFIETDPFDKPFDVLQEIEEEYEPMIVEQEGYDINCEKFGYSWKKPCFLFGEENRGVPKEMLISNKIYSIDQVGVLRSLNVSATCAIVLNKVAMDLKMIYY